MKTVPEVPPMQIPVPDHEFDPLMPYFIKDDEPETEDELKAEQPGRKDDSEKAPDVPIRPLGTDSKDSKKK